MLATAVVKSVSVSTGELVKDKKNKKINKKSLTSHTVPFVFQWLEDSYV